MGFLSGRLTFERFQVEGDAPKLFGPDEISALEKFAIGQVESVSADGATTGFLGGRHLFDTEFSLEKNVSNDALHAALRIDTHKIPGPLRKAWLEMELAALAAANPERRISRADRKQAQEAVQARCEEEIRTGKFRRMQQSAFLWDARDGVVYCSATSPGVQEQLRTLFEQAFGLELTRITAGVLAEQFARENKWMKAFDKLAPSRFHEGRAEQTVAWLSEQPESADYLGNEFFAWLWWYLAEESDSLELSDGTQVTAMLTKTLSLECPWGESGRETISAEAPVQLPEAFQALRSGKQPRKSGMLLAREGEHYDLVLQAESFGVGAAGIESADGGRGRGDERIDAIRRFAETLDLIFEAFCARRLTKDWEAELGRIRSWLNKRQSASRAPAA
ncbi:MAG TPA: hypothetical protein VHB77_11595 [Planctomycetaceae bacterium]|nr:hypothetical protein [Planctomycetaceae bacterium]